VSPGPDHAEILRSGPTAWNAWREENPSIVPDLAGIALKLSERQMGPINGGPINLKSALLQEAMLPFATLSAAELEAADLSGADLVHARLDRANLRAANLSGAQLGHANFAAADLTNAILCGASLSFANLTAADLQAADMTGADLEHARFDQANLQAANLSHALLDHADFAGANLAKANLCGANLYHAKNLTETQLGETIKSDSTILPARLQGSTSATSSSTEPAALDRRDLRPRARHAVPLDVSRISAYSRPAWIAGVILIGGALVTTGFVWQHMNEAVPLDTSDAKSGPQQSLSESKLSSNPDEQRPQPTAPDSLVDEKVAPERQRSADEEAQPLPPAASTVGRTEITPDQGPAPETDSATVSQEANANGEPQASDGAINEQARRTRDEGHDEPSEAAPLVSAESPVATSRHGTVPDLPAEPSEASALVSAESPVTTPRHATVPDLPAEASTPDPQLAEAAALALSTSGPSTASPVRDTVPPSVVTGALPSSVEQKDVETALPLDAVSPPLPVRKPNIQKGVSNPGLAETSPKPVRKSVTQKGDVDSKPDRSRQAKGQNFVDKKAEQGSGSGSITDLLAGGL
jgi:hypothetical protein